MWATGEIGSNRRREVIDLFSGHGDSLLELTRESYSMIRGLWHPRRHGAAPLPSTSHPIPEDGAKLDMLESVRCVVRWLLVIDSAGRRWELQPGNGHRANRVTRYSRRKENQPAWFFPVQTVSSLTADERNAHPFLWSLRFASPYLIGERQSCAGRR